MPKYSYRCTSCDNAFDIQQSFTDESLTVCPECGGSLRKLFGAVGISFKGSGFYRNDHGTKTSTSSDSASSTSESGPSSDSSSPAPTTPAPAAASTSSSASTSSAT